MNWKRCGRKHSWPKIRYSPGIHPEGLRKTMKSLTQDGCQQKLKFSISHIHIRSITA
jgi:hypothetical protein